MMDVNLIKNIAIILDFIVSISASAIQGSNPVMSGALFGLSAIILFIAVICVIVELLMKKK